MADEENDEGAPVIPLRGRPVTAAEMHKATDVLAIAQLNATDLLLKALGQQFGPGRRDTPELLANLSEEEREAASVLMAQLRRPPARPAGASADDTPLRDALTDEQAKAEYIRLEEASARALTILNTDHPLLHDEQPVTDEAGNPVPGPHADLRVAELIEQITAATDRLLRFTDSPPETTLTADEIHAKLDAIERSLTPHSPPDSTHEDA